MGEQGGETGRRPSEFAPMETVRIAVVTGATGALGRVVVPALLADGWTVHAPTRAPEHAAALRAAVGGAAARLHPLLADVGRADDVERLFGEVDARSGRLDALLNLAGGFAMGRIDERGPEIWHEMMAINATSAYLCCRAAVPRLRRSGGGRIVNVASAVALEPSSGLSAYAASKAAVVALTRALAAELAVDRITVNAIAPTTIDTPSARASMPEADHSRWVAPRAIVEEIRRLLAAEASAQTGSIVAMGR
jgi:NAD(P)-dependent dehydrogenase (short-subunit alcohol dehydrogenase family)